MAPTALARGQVLELDAQADCMVTGDEVLLSVLVRNLLDNALRYSPDHAKVVVTIERQQGGVQLSVHDSGPGMSDDAIQRLGERFFRVLGSEQPGSGLGWSIVCRLVDVFGAHAHVARSQALGGLAVTVLWPG
jgi:two-component system, OmpR family, sensor histidine kinase QseC